jgi:hypothetical protein
MLYVLSLRSFVIFLKSTQFFFVLVQENYLTASEQYIRESELSKRVQEWSEKLEPFLREQVNNNSKTIHIDVLQKILTKKFSKLKGEETNLRYSQIL